MTRKAGKTATGWRIRYLVTPDGIVCIIRGKGKKIGNTIWRQVYWNGKWDWCVVGDYMVIVDTIAELAALRLAGKLKGGQDWYSLQNRK